MDRHWFKNLIVYSVDVKSFCDGNGDGIGDFKGLGEKLDYIEDLGVTCLWLLPFFPSPWRDNGYDVIDYLDVDPRLGTLAEFQEFVRRASERGINVVIDLVLNHTSNEHPWFLAARRDRRSLFRDYYVWSELTPPRDPSDGPAFPDTEHGVWRFDESAGAYYYHKFYHFQPDLQVSNPRVQEEIQKVMDFWLSLGVSGFRLDAVPIMLKKKGLESTTPRNSQELLCKMRGFVTGRREGAVLMGEVDVEGGELIDYFADGGGLHLVFNFLLNAYLIGALSMEKAETLIRGWRELPVIPDGGNWLNFLRNLDELNLVQLPKRERDRVMEILAPEPRQRLYNRGIRRRLAPMLKDPRRVEMAISLLFSLPGTPMLVYGDEIGMGEHPELWERESVRTPMQWNGSPGAGFSFAERERFLRPLVVDEQYSPEQVNVELQQKDPRSLLCGVKRIIRARRKCPEIGEGRIGWVSTSHPGVLGHICHWKNDMLLAVHNLTSEALEVTLDLKTIYAKRLTCVLGETEEKSPHGSNHVLGLSPYQYLWFKVHYEKDQ